MKNQKYLESKSLSVVLFCFVFLLYAVVYMTKSMFASAMATIVEEGFMTKSQTGLINAVFWFVYAIFQVFGGFAADRYSPSKLIMIGVGGAAIVNIVIYFNQSYPVIMAAWAFNAVIQFGLWPGVFKIVSTQTAPGIRKTAVFWIIFATSVGLGLSMIVASFVSYWEMNFLVSAISLTAMLVIYVILTAFLDKKMVTEEVKVESENEKQGKVKEPFISLMLTSGLITLMIVCLLRCAIDNGIKMMTPVLLMESYEQLPAAISTRMSSLLVVFSAVGLLCAGVIQRKITRNEVKAQILLYAVSLLPLAVVCFVGQISYIYILLALSVSVLLLHGASPFSQSYIALRFEKNGRIGTVAGIFNATASVGNVFASYIFAKMAEMMPWKFVAGSWAAAIFLCEIFCIAVLPKWTRFIKK